MCESDGACAPGADTRLAWLFGREIVTRDCGCPERPAVPDAGAEDAQRSEAEDEGGGLTREAVGADGLVDAYEEIDEGRGGQRPRVSLLHERGRVGHDERRSLSASGAAADAVGDDHEDGVAEREDGGGVLREAGDGALGDGVGQHRGAEPRRVTPMRPKRPTTVDWIEIAVTLQHISPPIHRTLQLPAATPLSLLHDLLQIAFGWESAHLHEFRLGELRFAPVDEGGDSFVIDEGAVPLGAVLTGKGKLVYEYDFGDSWEHEIVLNAVVAASTRS